MTITVSLLITLTAILLLGGWTLSAAIGHADEGYEDAFGFWFGLPAAAQIFIPQSQPAPLNIAARPAVPTFAPTDSTTDTTTQAVTIFVSETGRTASALYRRHRRSSNSSAAFPVPSTSTSSTASASPFAIQCAATRARASRTNPASPFPVGDKSIFGDGAAL